MKFIDLFAGIGGFNKALTNLGHECVFASEINETLRALYKTNFGMDAAGDIRRVDVAEIPPHDILCAGFPCQPFSKARDYSDPTDPDLSELYLQILRVIRYHRPHYFILENVPNLEKHDDGQTWEEIKDLLRAEDYFVDIEKLSPHEFGIPQIRERMYIVGSLTSLDEFMWPKKREGKGEESIESVLDAKPIGSRSIPGQVKRCLDVWQEFLDLVPKDVKIPHPLWSMEFGATYPYERKAPWAVTTNNLRRYRGSYGRRLSEANAREDIFALLPSHARTEQHHFPKWKIGFIKKNRRFYECHRLWLDNWIEKIRKFPSSFQKLEWNCQEKNPRKEVRLIREYVIQMRASGVRIKRKTTAPSLVAMTATQVPIIGWEERYMTPTECKRLQSMETLELPRSDSNAYAALGNAINVQVARLVAEALIGNETPDQIPSQHDRPTESLGESQVEPMLVRG